LFICDNLIDQDGILKIIGRARTSSTFRNSVSSDFGVKSFILNKVTKVMWIHSSADFGFTGDNPNDLDEVRMSAMGVGR
jgi:hypothetical protein